MDQADLSKEHEINIEACRISDSSPCKDHVTESESDKQNVVLSGMEIENNECVTESETNKQNVVVPGMEIKNNEYVTETETETDKQNVVVPGIEIENNECVTESETNKQNVVIHGIEIENNKYVTETEADKQNVVVPGIEIENHECVTESETNKQNVVVPGIEIENNEYVTESETNKQNVVVPGIEIENNEYVTESAIVSELFSNLNLVELVPTSNLMCDDKVNNYNFKDDRNQVSLVSHFCVCNNQYDQEVCPYCQLLRCTTAKDDKKHIIKEKYRFFDDAVTLSQHLVEESTTWLTDTVPVHKDYTLNLDNQPLLFPMNQESELLENGILRSTYILHGSDIVSNGDEVVTSIIEDDLVIDEIVDEIIDKNKHTFQTLPEEVKLKIFSYFTQRELCCYIAPVCSSWFRLSKDPLFWTHILAADFEDAESNLLVEVIVAWCKNLAVLELNRRTDITLTNFSDIFKNCPHIQSLSLAFCSQFGDKVLSLLPINCKLLTSINMEGCNQVTDQSFYNFVGLPLTRICVSHCNQLSDEGGIFLARNFRNLVEVNFDGIQWITEEFVEILVENHFESLQKVYLDGENLTDSTLKLFSHCSNLNCLSFSFCTNMTHEALSWVGKCTKLNHLMLRKGSNFTNEGLLNYLKNMSEEQANNFKHLNLAECTEISDECLFHLSEKCVNLEVLDLSWCWEVSDDGLAFIVDNCHKLKELYLRGLHELYGTPFTRIMKNIPGLTFLDLSQCNKVQDELIEHVVEKMKDLIVYNYYGDIVVNALHRRAHLVT